MISLATFAFIIYVLALVAGCIALELQAPADFVGVVSWFFLIFSLTTMFFLLVEFFLGLGYYLSSKKGADLLASEFKTTQIEEKQVEKSSNEVAKTSATFLDQGRLICLIAAYLPNEKDIIMETLGKVFEAAESAKSKGRIQVILAYNTPQDMPELETKLAALESQKSGLFRVVRVMKSSSKAENLNYVLKNYVNDNDVIGIFDADHWPTQGSFDRVLYLMDRECKTRIDCIQGRCIIRNENQSWLAHFLVAPEFDFVFGLMHSGRYLLSGFGIFGGTNGYWRADILKELNFDNNLLTEDVDITVRAVTKGYKIIHDPHVSSLELAPTKISTFLKQRQRWALGWFQILLQRPWLQILFGSLPFQTKFGMVHLLIWRELIIQLNLVSFIFNVSNTIVKQFRPTWVPSLPAVLIGYVLLGLGVFVTLLTVLGLWLVLKRKFFPSLAFAVVYPVYIFILVVLSIHSSFRILIDRRKQAWHVTPRN